jgi:type III secretory pathway component EscS
MELPKKMISRVIETEKELIITTPNKKSWGLIFFFSILTLQFSIGLITILTNLNDETLPLVFKLLMPILCVIIIYFILKEILWQMKGVNEIKISSNQVMFSKSSPLNNIKKIYNLSNIKAFEVKDESVSIGPFAMLQILGITDKIKINMTYGYETITILGGVDISEAKELKDKLEKHIKPN